MKRSMEGEGRWMDKREEHEKRKEEELKVSEPPAVLRREPLEGDWNMNVSAISKWYTSLVI